MNFKVIIAGSRTFNNYELLVKKCDIILKNIKTPIEIVSGTALGADKLGEKYAKSRNYTIKQFPADWSLGKKAGYIRNKQMAEYADALIAFWDYKSFGTKLMLELAQKHNLKIRIVQIPTIILPINNRTSKDNEYDPSRDKNSWGYLDPYEEEHRSPY